LAAKNASPPFGVVFFLSLASMLSSLYLCCYNQGFSPRPTNVHTNPAIHLHVTPSADYETRQVNLLQEGLDLRNNFFELFDELHQELVIPIPF
jgi:hypothetical protein